MPALIAKKKKPDVQRLSRGSSFKRIAQDYRIISKNPGLSLERREDFRIHAEIHDAEAKRLRAMR